MSLTLILINKIVLSCFFSAAIAQTAKALLIWKKNKRFNWRDLFLAAYMPSSHTATVVALSLSLFLTEGITNLSIAAAVLSLIVIRDVLHDKTFARKQENVLNSVIDKLIPENSETVIWHDFHGHSLKEVFAGMIIGILVTLLIFNL